MAWPGSDVSGARCLGFGDALWSADDTGVHAFLLVCGSRRNARSAAVNLPLRQKRSRVQRHALVLKLVLIMSSLPQALFTAMAMRARVVLRSLPAMPSPVVLQRLSAGHWQIVSRSCWLTQPHPDLAARVVACATSMELIKIIDAIDCFIMKGLTVREHPPMKAVGDPWQ